MADSVYTAEMGQPPMDPEGAPSAKKPAAKKPAPKTSAPKKTAPRDTVFREGMPVPQDVDGASVSKKSKGGSVSSRADGCCTKVKTRGKFV